MRRASKVDGNHAEIVGALTSEGATVLSLAPIGNGCPDLLVAFGRPATLVLMELKNKAGKNKVNEAQQKWHAQWPTTVHVVRTPEDALKVIGVIA